MPHSNESIRISAAVSARLDQNSIRRKLDGAKTATEQSRSIRDTLETSDRDSDGSIQPPVLPDPEPQAPVEEDSAGRHLDLLG